MVQKPHCWDSHVICSPKGIGDFSLFTMQTAAHPKSCTCHCQSTPAAPPLSWVSLACSDCWRSTHASHAEGTEETQPSHQSPWRPVGCSIWSGDSIRASTATRPTEAAVSGVPTHLHCSSSHTLDRGQSRRRKCGGQSSGNAPSKPLLWPPLPFSNQGVGGEACTSPGKQDKLSMQHLRAKGQWHS